MKNWADSPFLEYTCNKQRNKNTYTIEKKHEKVPCADCKVERANKKCSYKMCKGCCAKHCVRCPDIDLCKEKGYAKSAQEARLRKYEEEDGVKAEKEENIETDD